MMICIARAKAKQMTVDLGYLKAVLEILNEGHHLNLFIYLNCGKEMSLKKVADTH